MTCYAIPETTDTVAPFDLPGALERCRDMHEITRESALEAYRSSREPGWGGNPFAYPASDTTWFQAFRVYMHLRSHLDDKAPHFGVDRTGSVEVTWGGTSTFRVEVRDGLLAWWARGHGERLASGQGGNLVDLLTASAAWQGRVRGTP